MYSSDVLNICLETGIELSVRDGQLAYRGPASALTPELVGGLKANKAEIIHILCDQRTGPAALIVRARNGGEWLNDQHSAWVAGDPDAASNERFSTALEVWDLIERTLRQVCGHQGCVLGPDQFCQADAPVRCDSCEG